LHRVKSITLRYALYCKNVSTVVAYRKRKARIDPSSVDEDRTGAALAAVATFLSSCQFQTFA